MTKYGMFGALRAQEGKGEELLKILIDASKAMREVKGCQLYVVSEDVSEQDCIRVFEVWDRKEDHDNSLNDTRAKELIQQALPILSGKPESVELEVDEDTI